MLKESPMGFTLYAPSGEVLRRSNTLRGLIDHASSSPVRSVHLVRDTSPQRRTPCNAAPPMPTTYQHRTQTDE